MSEKIIQEPDTFQLQIIQKINGSKGEADLGYIDSRFPLAKGVVAKELKKMVKAGLLTESEGFYQVATEPAKMPEFNSARKHVEAIREHGRRAAHESILLGHELNRLKKELGIQRGGNRAKPQSAVLPPWQQLVEEQTGLSIDTCDRCMTLATAAKKHIPILTAGDVLETPFAALPEKRQAEVVKALEKAADGQSMTQMMFAFGAWKQKAVNHPPKPTKESAAKRNANKSDEALQMQMLAEHAEENAQELMNMALGEAWKALESERLLNFITQALALASTALPDLASRKACLPALVDLENQASRFSEAISTHIKDARRTGR